MPELPEVETVRRVLTPQLLGQRIESVEIVNPAVIARPQPDAFAAALLGRRITATARRGKFLTLALDDGSRLTLHLRMTGCLLAAPAGTPRLAHTHLVLHLTDSELRFSDSRRFGRFWLLAPGEEDTFTGAARLGPEPFDAALTADYLRAKLGKSRRAIKSCLLDQSVVAGIGNIYSDEILFAAGIRPTRPAARLRKKDWQALAWLIPERLAFFIDKNAIDPADYLAGGGEDYRNTPFLQVYGRAGEPCPRCGTPLTQVVIGGRSSVFCRRCQR